MRKLGLALMGMAAGLSLGAEAPKSEKADCSGLTYDEQVFAGKMTEWNRKMFCEKFDARLRKSAMMLACSGPSNCGANKRSGKKIITPNEAVKKVAKDSRISMAEKRESAAEY